MISLLIVDDHPVYRDALHQYLSRRFHGNNVKVSSASTIAEGIKLAQSQNTPWAVLLDLSIPDAHDHLSGIKQFKNLHNVRDIAAISGLDEDLWKEQCLSAGCRLFISKNNDVDYIYKQLESMMSTYIEATSTSNLTQRQQEILKYIAEGQSNKMIAYNLDIKEQTVKIHVNLLFKELKVSNRTQAVYQAKLLGLI